MAAPATALRAVSDIPWADRVKFIAAAVPVTAYIFGLLVTNYYLYRIGESDFWSFKVKYIYTGFFSLVVPAMFFVALLSFCQRITWVLGCLLLLAVSGMIFYYPWTYNETHGIAVQGIKHLALGGLVMALSVFAVIKLFHKPRYRWWVGVICSALFWLMTTDYIQAYADHIYPYVGDVFGGGKGRLVQLWIDSNEPVPSTLSLPMLDNKVSKSVTLVLERDDYLVVCTGEAFQTRVLRIQKSLIKAVQIVPPPQPVHPCWAQAPKSF